MRIALASFALLFAAPADAAILCVNPGGTGGCFASIQAAVDAATSADEIEVAAGTYTEMVVIPSGETHTIRGAGASVTTVDGEIQVDPGAFLSLADLGITGQDNGLEVREARATAERVRAFDNDFAGFVALGSRLDLVECTASGNFVGVLSQDSEVIGPNRLSRTSIVRSTINGNGSDGVNAAGSVLTVEDSTISTNAGSGIFTAVTRVRLRVKRTTITGNQAADGAGGMFVGPRTRAVLLSTIVAGNTATNGANDVDDGGFHARFRSRGYNLIGDPVGTEGMSGRTDLDLVGVDPLLQPLADNGGPTETHALGIGSPARGAVTATVHCQEPDQRGVPRAAPCDIGAYEAP
jgi:hypothetical protein